MADRLVVAENDRHEYVVTTMVAGMPIDLLIDTGFTSPQCRTGVGLDAATFRRLGDRLGRMRRVLVSGMGNEQLAAGAGAAHVELRGLAGSRIDTQVVDVGINILGICYFHRLPGFDVSWNLRRRTMTIERR